MKKTSMQISFDSEKLGALRQYMFKKEVTIEPELEEVIQKLYEKHVPALVREYIESRPEEAGDKPKKQIKPSNGSSSSMSSL